MATVTQSIAQFVDDVSGLTAEVQIDYSDTLLRIEVVRCINPTSRPVLVMATRLANGRTYSNTFPAGQTSFINIPSGPNDRLTVFVNPTNGRIDGVEYQIRWVVS
jgi:hypothetical protein